MQKDYFLRSCLANLAKVNNNPVTRAQDRDYYRGLLVGIVSALMDNYKTNNFEKAVKRVAANLPDDCIPLDSILPECWKNEFSKNL